MTLRGGAGTLLINNTFVSAGDLTLSGGQVENYSSALSASNTLTITGGAVHFQAGSGNPATAFANIVNIGGSGILLDGGTVLGDFVDVQASGAATVTGSSLGVRGGSGANAFAQLQGGTLDVNVSGSVDVTGGTGTDAFAALLASTGGVTVNAATVVLTAGLDASANTDAVVVANGGLGAITITAASCSGCETLLSDPFLNPPTESGVFGDPIMVPAAPTVTNVGDITTNEVLVLKEFFDDTTGGVDRGVEEDDDELQTLTCTFD